MTEGVDTLELQTLGKLLVVMSVALAIVGGMLWFAGRLGLGGMPGSFKFEGDGWTCFVPIVASIVISILLTIVLNVVLRWFR